MTPSVGLRVSTFCTTSTRSPGAAIAATSGMTTREPAKTHLSLRGGGKGGKGREAERQGTEWGEKGTQTGMEEGARQGVV